ncbi:hypothetical protein HOU08_gp179 [Dickeya phage vB_DsoM_JA29]|uniref:Uncharacterized protein n=1 Tax=Dickeya phage vB_DsoM_JA29 TaxID=2283031 RepID=A0A384ZXG3_9CAUD|nr:hypothetical protein HOU08_gp179 [Dickeya phage vB_DsoM_JA29]AXG66905.1 hypothetical protein JA29_179 [Dickeya phage vB_DsoM_JA29]
MEIEVSLSALTPSQYRPFMQMWRPDPKMLQLFQKISGRTGRKAMRLYFDFQSDKLIKTFAPECPSEIKDYLVEKGFVLEDYLSGTVKDKHNRILRLGKVLKDPELKKIFETDPSRKALVEVTRGKKSICLSMHPYDVAGMSTGRGWTSCMNLDDGINKQFVRDDIKQHTLIAYLVDTTDRDIKRPLSRVLIKRFYSEQSKDKFIYHVERVYPAPNMPFIESVQTFVDQKINKELLGGESLEYRYRIHEDLYSDTRESIFPQLTYAESNPAEVKNILATHPLSVVSDMQWSVLARRFKDELFGMIFTQERLESPHELNSEVLATIIEAFKSVLSERDFEMMMARISAFAIRSEREVFASIVLQQVILQQSETGAKLFGMNGSFGSMVRRLSRSLGVWAPFAREKLSQRYRIVKMFVDLFIRKNFVRDSEVALEAIADMAGEGYSAKTDQSFMEAMKEFEDVMPMAYVIDHAVSFRRSEYQLRALFYSKAPDANYEVSIGSYVITVIMRKMSEASRKKLADYFGVDNEFNAGSRVADDPRFPSLLKEGAEVFNFGYTEDGHGKMIFYPTTVQSEKDLRFGVEESILDAALVMMDDEQ